MQIFALDYVFFSWTDQRSVTKRDSHASYENFGLIWCQKMSKIWSHLKCGQCYLGFLYWRKILWLEFRSFFTWHSSSGTLSEKKKTTCYDVAWVYLAGRLYMISLLKLKHLLQTAAIANCHIQWDFHKDKNHLFGYMIIKICKKHSLPTWAIKFCEKLVLLKFIVWLKNVH